MLLQHREVVTALRQRIARRRSARRALWSGVASRRAVGVAIAGLLVSTSGVTGAVAAPRSGAKAPAAQRTIAAGTGMAEIGWGVQVRNTATALGVAREGELGRAALALLRIDWADLYPGWTIAFLPARTEYLGMTLVPQRRVEIYVRTDRSAAAIAHDIAHELGHVTDVMYNDDVSRARFLAFRGLGLATPWWTCSGCRDLQVPAGDFAETFALVAAPRYRFYSEVAAEPSAAALADFQQHVLPAAARAGFLPVAPQADA
jgi:hypothetical protein